MNRNLIMLFLLGISLFGCSEDDDRNEIVETLEISYDFSEGMEEWQADFADYPEDEEDFYELSSGWSSLPEPLDENENSIKQSGNNHSDDLFMFIKRKITGLEPNRAYLLRFSVEFATNAASDSFGVGGSPGSSVYIKAGSSETEPLKVLDDLGIYSMNIDKGNQAEEGRDMINLGNFSNGLEENSYALKTLSNEEPFRVQSNNNGEVWVIFGTDSGFEATTTIYYNKISLIFQ